MNINSLLFTCEHPKTITTKDNRKMVVSCGKCRSCLVQKQRSKSLVCSEQEKLSKYCFFITLTYDRFNVPCLYPIFKHDKATKRQIVELYDEVTGELVAIPQYPHNLLRKIMSRCDDKKLHYCRYSDLQKFMKRLRRKIDYKQIYGNEKIKYYSVSEYGPKTFRPHFHVLLYFDNAKLAQDIGKLVHSSWTFGYSYTTLSRGGVSSYVASYVNSLLSVPEVFKTAATQPKSSHSSRLALPLYEDEFKEVLKNEPSKLVRYVKSERDGVVSLSSPWRSFKSYLFPKCYGYSYKSIYERVATYNLLQTIYRRYGKKKIKDYLTDIKEDFYLDRLPSRISVALLTPDGASYKLPSDDILLGRLYQAKHYYNLMSMLDLSPIQLAINVDRFYSALDYTNLKEMYQTIQESEHILAPSDYELFSHCFAYQSQISDDDVVEFNGMLLEVSWLKDTYYKSNLYASLANSRAASYQKSIKHKYLNDLNQIFIVNNEQCNVYEVD